MLFVHSMVSPARMVSGSFVGMVAAIYCCESSGFISTNSKSVVYSDRIKKSRAHYHTMKNINVKFLILGAFLTSTLFLGGAATGTTNKENLEKRDVCAAPFCAHKWVRISRIINTFSGPKTVSYYACGKCGVRQPPCGNGFQWRCRVR